MFRVIVVSLLPLVVLSLLAPLAFAQYHCNSSWVQFSTRQLTVKEIKAAIAKTTKASAIPAKNESSAASNSAVFALNSRPNKPANTERLPGL
jgi:cell division protein FtsB